METGLLSNVLLPIAIILIMITMGMTLTRDDFRRLATQKRAVAVGLVCQLLLLPLIGFATAWIFGLATVFAFSMVLLASCPGGSTSNLMVHVTDADRPLSLTLTTLSNVVVFASMPLYLGLAQRAFGSLEGEASVPIGDIGIQVAALTVVPIAIGMAVRDRAPDFALAQETRGKVLATVVLFAITLGLVVENFGTIVDEIVNFGPAFISLNVSALFVGWAVASRLGFTDSETATIAIETGTQNVTIAIAIALTIFDSQDMALVPGLYGLWSLVTGFSFAFFMRFQRTRRLPKASLQESLA